MASQRIRILAPSAVTAANVAAGFLSMVAAAEARFEVSVYLLVLAVTLDMLDGVVARILDATSEFGQELDSFSDALSFGAAPALLLYLACLREHRVLGLLAVVVYLLAAITRLTRFNLKSDAHAKERKTDGVPVPVAAGYIMATVLMRDHIPWTVAVVVPLVFALLMISHLRLPNLKGRNVVTATMLVGVANYFAVVLWPSWYTVGWWNVWNVVILAVAYAQDRRVELEAVETDLA